MRCKIWTAILLSAAISGAFFQSQGEWIGRMRAPKIEDTSTPLDIGKMTPAKKQFFIDRFIERMASLEASE